VPLIPYFAGAGQNALPWTIGLAAVGLFAVGAALSLFTGRNAVYSGGRMLALGAVAGGVTFALGRVLGIAVG
jgi:VIT1/CCC1 family predicted Fe2+/Mn2+ transporter